MNIVELYKGLHDKVEELSVGTVGSKPIRLEDQDYRENMFNVIHDIETDIALYKSELRKYDDKQSVIR